MLRKLIPSLLASLSALLLTSCFEQSETVTINADGSGTIVQELIFGADMWQEMKVQAEEGLEEEEKEMIALAEKMGEGVEFKNAEMVEKMGGKGGMKVTYTFNDISKVQLLSLEDSMNMDMGGMEMGGGEEEEAEPEVSFALAGDKLTVNMLALQEEPAADEAEEEDEMDMDMDMGEMKGMMKMMLGEAKMSRSLVFSSGIDETNASHVDGKEVTLFEVPFSAIFEQENWEDLMEMEGENPLEEAKTMDAVEGIDMETQKSFVVDMGE